MEAKQACTARDTDQHQPVIVELTAEGTACIRQVPPDVLVMVVESRKITASGRRSVAAGARGPVLTAETAEVHDRPTPRRIPVNFPG